MRQPGVVFFASVSAFSVFAGVASAEGETASEVLSRLSRGQRVRVQAVGAKEIEGHFVAVRDGRVVIDRPAAALALDAIHGVWIRDRAAATGAAIGGGLIGVATAGLFALVGYASCREADCMGTAVGMGAAGLLLGAAAGGATGGLAGAAVPRWRRVYPSDTRGNPGGTAVTDERARSVETPTPTPSAAEIRTPEAAEVRDPFDAIASASLHAGYGRSFDSESPSGGVGARFSLSPELKGGVRPGVEVGRIGLGVQHRFAPTSQRLESSESVVHFGLTAALGPSRGTLRPYAIVGIGHYTWSAHDHSFHEGLGVRKSVNRELFLGGSIGAGARVHTAGPLYLGMEGRYHTRLANQGRGEREFRVLSLTAGATLAW
jgi:hypothetical protein